MQTVVEVESNDKGYLKQFVCHSSWSAVVALSRLLGTDLTEQLGYWIVNQFKCHPNGAINWIHRSFGLGGFVPIRIHPDLQLTRTCHSMTSTPNAPNS